MKEQRMIFDEDNLRNAAMSEIKTCISNLKEKIEEAQSALTISEDDWSGSSKDALTSNIGAIKDTAMSQANALEDIIAGIEGAISNYNNWERNVEAGLDGQTSDMCPIHLTPKINGVCPKCLPNNSGAFTPVFKDSPYMADEIMLNLADLVASNTLEGQIAAIVLAASLDFDNNRTIGGERYVWGKLVSLGKNGSIGGSNYKTSITEVLNNSDLLAKAQESVNYTLQLSTATGQIQNEYSVSKVKTGQNGQLITLDGQIIPSKNEVFDTIRTEHRTQAGGTSKVHFAYETASDGTVKIIGVLYIDSNNGGQVIMK